MSFSPLVKPCLLLSICLFCITSIFAQDSLMIEEVLVTATRIPQESFKTGKHVRIIDQKEIKKLPIQSVDELLQFVAGININARGGFGTQADIGMRGSTFAQVLIYIDGIRLNDPLTAHFNHQFPVTFDEIDQIEIISGPAAAAYGSDAVGGLIHIKTKSFADQFQKNTSLYLDLKGGSHQYGGGEIGLQLSKEKFYLGLFAHSNQSIGENLNNPNFDLGISEDSLYRTYFNISSASASFGLRPGKGLKISGKLAYDYRDFAAKYYYTRSAYDESIETVKTWWGQTSLEKQWNKHSIQLSYGSKLLNDYFLFNPLFSANEHNATQNQVQLNHLFHANDNISFASGVHVIQKSIESNDRGNHKNSSIGYYVNYSQDIINRWFINGSLRLEQDQNFGTALLPQISISFKKKNYVIRTSIGRSIRAADFTERYVSSQIESLSPGRNIGNPDLFAEKSDSYEIGFDYYPKNNWKINGTTFFRASQNLIDFSLRNADDIDNVPNLLAGEEYFYADNISESNVLGVEISLSNSFRFSNTSTLNARVNYTWLKTSIDGNIISKYISNHPKHQTSAVLNFNWSKLNLTSSTRFIMRQGEVNDDILSEIPAQYLVSDLKLDYQFNKKGLVYLELKNILDIKYQEILGANLPGRWLILGVNLRFSKT